MADRTWLAEMRRRAPPGTISTHDRKQVRRHRKLVHRHELVGCLRSSGCEAVEVESTLQVWVGVDASVKRDTHRHCSDGLGQKVSTCAPGLASRVSADRAGAVGLRAAIERTLLKLGRRFACARSWLRSLSDARDRKQLATRRSSWRSFRRQTESDRGLAELFELIKGDNLDSYPEAALRLAVSRAIAAETARGWRIAKASRPHKIDVVIALAMAALAAILVRPSRSAK